MERDKHRDGKFVAFKKGLIKVRIKEFEINKLETICLEITIFGKKG